MEQFSGRACLTLDWNRIFGQLGETEVDSTNRRDHSAKSALHSGTNAGIELPPDSVANSGRVSSRQTGYLQKTGGGRLTDSGISQPCPVQTLYSRPVIGLYQVTWI